MQNTEPNDGAGRNANDRDADWRDIQASLSGSSAAYGRLVRRYEEKVAAQMWRFSRNPDICESLVQDVFVEAYYSLERFRGDAPFLHWLRRIATRAGYRFWKQRKKDADVISWEEAFGAVEPDAPFDAAKAGTLLHALLAQLPPADRLVLTLMYFEECSVKEIADRMGWTRGMTKMRAYRARKKLKALAERTNILGELEWTR